MARPKPVQGTPFKISEMAIPSRPGIPSTAQRVNLGGAVVPVVVGDSRPESVAAGIENAGRAFGGEIVRRQEEARQDRIRKENQDFARTEQREAWDRADQLRLEEIALEEEINAPLREEQIRAARLRGDAMEMDIAQQEAALAADQGAQEALVGLDSYISETMGEQGMMEELRTLEIPEVPEVGQDESNALYLAKKHLGEDAGASLDTIEGLKKTAEGVQAWYESELKRSGGMRTDEVIAAEEWSKEVIGQLTARQEALQGRQEAAGKAAAIEGRFMQRRQEGLSPREVSKIYRETVENPTLEGESRFFEVVAQRYPDYFGGASMPAEQAADVAKKAAMARGEIVYDESAWDGMTENAKKEVMKSDIAEVQAMKEAAGSSTVLLSGLDTLEGLVDELGDAQGGFKARAMSAFSRALNLGENATPLMVFDSVVSQLTPVMRQGMPGAASDRDVAMFQAALPNIGNSKEANQRIIKHLRRIFEKNEEYIRFADEAKGRIPLSRVNRSFEKYTDYLESLTDKAGIKDRTVAAGEMVKIGDGSTRPVMSFRDYFRSQYMERPRNDREEAMILRNLPPGTPYFGQDGTVMMTPDADLF